MVSTADNTEIPPSSARSRLVAFVVAVSFFMQMLDSTIVVTSLPQMARSFGVEPVAMSIGLTVYMLTMAAFIPLSGWLGSRYGARNVFLAAIAIFVAASLFCGLSTTLAQFIAARAVQGFGAALMNPIGRIIVLRNAAKRDLVNAVALITWPALIAPVIGPVLGSFITTYVSWHWNFFINIPIGLIGLALVWHFVPQQKEQDAGRLDVIGFVLSALGLTLLLAGLESFVHGTVATEGVIVLLAAGLIMSAWAVRHFYRTDNPLLDLSAFSIPTFAFFDLIGRNGVTACDQRHAVSHPAAVPSRLRPRCDRDGNLYPGLFCRKSGDEIRDHAAFTTVRFPNGACGQRLAGIILDRRMRCPLGWNA